MHVVFLYTAHPFKYPNGPSRVIVNIAKQLFIRGFDITLIFTDYELMLPHKIVPAQGFKIIFIPIRKYLAPSYFIPSMTYKLVRRILPHKDKDVVYHMHSIIYAPIANEKTIYTDHGSKSGNLYERAMLRIIIEGTQIVTTLSKRRKIYLEKIYGIKPILIPNGVDTKMYRPIASIQKEDNLVLFIGRLDKEKGVLDVIKLAKVLPEVNFAIAGKGPLEKLVIDSSKKLKNITYLGFIDGMEKVYYYNKATIAVFPSYRENFPLVGLESMACGTAVIASKIGFDEYIVHGFNGFLVKPGDIYAIKKYIKELIADNNLRKRIEKNALETVKKYDWTNIVDRYIHLYLSLI